MLMAFGVEGLSRLTINGRIKVQVEKGASIRFLGKTRINSGAFFNPIGRNHRTTLICREGGVLTIGNNVGISSTAIICHKNVTIGDNVRIGGNVVIYDTDFHSMSLEERTSSPEVLSNIKKKEVVIEDGVFIGAHSTILKGARIGENSVIGAGSVVRGTIPPNQVWMGNPAKYVADL
ncbi:MAG: acyltransferase [Cyclobacteriaceae bacterium]